MDDKVKCKENKWRININKINNGKIKCKEKNRFNVALLIENQPQIHNTIVSPI